MLLLYKNMLKFDSHVTSGNECLSNNFHSDIHRSIQSYQGSKN